MTFPTFGDQLYIHADRTRVKQVMVNLLSNAIKYNHAGGSVTVECAMSPNDQVRISVTDTGCGLSPEQLKQLYQPFNRLGQEARSEEGTGIGLVVTKQLVELMGGVIGVESTVGVGSTFWFDLATVSPPALMEDCIAPVNEVEANHLAMNESSQLTLLYVEDNPANLALVEQLIARRSDLKMLSAIDGHQGIKLAHTFQPDIILMDINLPGISGFDALAILRKDTATQHIPVLALSANALPSEIKKGLEAGFFRYLTKPIKVLEFMDALDTALHYAKENAALSNAENERITEK